MIIEIQAKTILSPVRPRPDTWFGMHYSINFYRGCEHQCIYCDSRSECYGIENFHDTLVKVNGLDLLRDELPRKRHKGIIGLGSMSDPYTKAELKYNLTGAALAEFARYGFGVHIITKSDLVLKDLAVLRDVARVSASVSFTVTTADDELARKIEPGAPPPSARFAAMGTLAAAGIHTGAVMMPVLPFIEDNVPNIAAIVEATAAAGGGYIVPAFGMTMRDRQRDYYYQRLDELFPGLSRKYEATYGDRYSCACPDKRELERFFTDLCAAKGIATRFIAPGEKLEQGRLF